MAAMAVLIRGSVAAHNKPPPDAPTQDCRLWPYSCRGTSACAAQLQMLLASACWRQPARMCPCRLVQPRRHVPPADWYLPPPAPGAPPRPRPCTPCSRQPGHALSPSRLHRLLLPGLQQGCGGGLQQPAPQAVQQIQGTQHPHPPAGVPASWPPAWVWAHATAMQCLPAARRAGPNMQRAVVRLPLSHTGCIL
jgi:hypothetical protein